MSKTKTVSQTPLIIIYILILQNMLGKVKTHIGVSVFRFKVQISEQFSRMRFFNDNFITGSTHYIYNKGLGNSMQAQEVNVQTVPGMAECQAA